MSEGASLSVEKVCKLLSDLSEMSETPGLSSRIALDVGRFSDKKPGFLTRTGALLSETGAPPSEAHVTAAPAFLRCARRGRS